MSSASYEETIKRLQARLDLVRDLVERASKMPHMTESDLIIAREAVGSIDYGETIFLRSMNKLRESHPALAGDIAWAFDFLHSGTLLAASRATLSDSAFKAAEYKRAQDMRVAKSQSDHERLLLEAIETALANRDPAQRGLSAKILPQVNRHLTANGQAEVDRFVIARRLKNVRS